MPPINRNLSNGQIDDVIEDFNCELLRIHNNHSQKIALNIHKPPFSDKVQNFLKVKHRWQKELKKIYHRTGNRISPEYTILSKQIQLLKIIIQNLINTESAQAFSNKLKTIKPGPSAFKKVAQLTGKNKSSFLPNFK